MTTAKEIKENCPEVSEILNSPPPFYVRYGTIITMSFIFLLTAISALIYIPSEQSFDIKFAAYGDTLASRNIETENNFFVVVLVDNKAGLINMAQAQFQELRSKQNEITIKLASSPIIFTTLLLSPKGGKPVIQLVNNSGQPVVFPKQFKETLTIRFPKRSIFQNIIKKYKPLY